MTPEEETVTAHLADALAEVARAVEHVLDGILPEGEDAPEADLFAAMRYATLDGGKRLRPFLVVASASLFDVPQAVAVRVGAAVELVHSYSLIHDDLPSMDDDPVRRGKPSCHVRFGDATAILAGDALMPLAFEMLADPATHPDASVRVALVSALAQAVGARGMVAGQVVDLAAERRALDAAEITRMERLKTGALIGFSCEAGAILGRAGPDKRKALTAYAHDLGLAYQIADDLLDVEGVPEDMGKEGGRDAERGKATFISILGADKARAQASLLAQQACAHLDPFMERAALLRALAAYAVERRS